jgi:ribosomal protein S18 acetylase RimI-like enzyme
LTIERINHRDPHLAEQVVAVQRAAYRVEAELIGFDGIPPLHETLADVMALELTILGISERDRLVAMIGYLRADSRVEINRLAVHPDQFRRGLARRLIAELHAREADATRFDVSTGRDNQPAVALYTRMGYRRVADLSLPAGIVITTFRRDMWASE